MLRRAMPAWALAAIVVIGQALAYTAIMPLSLGPRVVLQPWLLRRGFLLYDQIGDEHSPLLSLLLAFWQPFVADGLLLAKIVLIVLLAGVTLLTFYAALRAGRYPAALLAVVFMALWSPYFGYGKLWHETLLAPLYMLILLQWRPGAAGQDRRRAALVTGLLLGLAVAAKQHAGLAALGVAAWHSLAGRRNGRASGIIVRELLIMAAAALVPIVLFVAYQLASGGTLANLAYWTVGFAFLSDQARLSLQWPTLSQVALLAPAYLLLLPFVLRWLSARRFTDEGWLREGLALILLVAGSVTVFPRFGLFHLQPALPILAWLSGLTLVRLSGQVRRVPAVQALLVLAFLSLWLAAAGQAYLRGAQGAEAPEITEYSDLVPLAGELRTEIPAGVSFYVMPDNEAVSNLYYLLQTEPPRFWVPTSYAWFMTPAVRARALLALRQQSPQWIIDLPDGWGFADHGRPILDFVRANYQPVTRLPWAGGEVQLLRLRSAAESR